MSAYTSSPALPAAIAAAAVSSVITYYYCSTRVGTTATANNSGTGSRDAASAAKGAKGAKRANDDAGGNSPFATGWADAAFRDLYDAQPRSVAAKGTSPAGVSLPGPNATAALIRQRRSIFPKDFSAEHRLPLNVIEEMLEAANWAPTHGKTEPWLSLIHI